VLSGRSAGLAAALIAGRGHERRNHRGDRDNGSQDREEPLRGHRGTPTLRAPLLRQIEKDGLAPARRKLQELRRPERVPPGRHARDVLPALGARGQVGFELDLAIVR